MQAMRLTYLILLALCVAVVGCGEEPGTPNTPSSPSAEPQTRQALAMVLETSEPTFWHNGERVDAIGFVAQVVTMPSKVDRGYEITIDESFEREAQLRVLLDPTWENEKSAVDLEAEADAHFTQWKDGFDRLAKEGLVNELAFYQSLAETSSEQVKQLQQTLQTFQEARRGLPQTDASRLERRKLERQIETTLQAQIDANKRVESLKKKIDREQFVTLVRVR